MPEARVFRRAGRGKSASPVRRGESGSRNSCRLLSYSTGENLSAGIAAQSLHLEHGRFQRRVPHQPHQRGWLFLAVHFSAAALGTRVAGMERGMRDGDPIGTTKRSGRIAPMTGGCRSAGIRLACRRCIRRQNSTGFLRIPFLLQSLGHSMERGLELLAFRLTQRRALAAIDDLVQLVQVHVDPSPSRHN